LLPNTFERSMKLPDEAISPSFSSLPATEATEAPDGTMNAVSFSTAEAPHHPQANQASARNARKATATPARQPRFTTSCDLFHHQAGVGAAEAEAVVEYGADRALFGLVRHQVDALAAVRRIVEVE